MTPRPPHDVELDEEFDPPEGTCNGSCDKHCPHPRRG